jgi:hypothetical protein
VGVAEVEDLSPWRVGVAGAKRVVVGFAAGGVQWSWWAGVANGGVVFSGGRRERERSMEKY